MINAINGGDILTFTASRSINSGGGVLVGGVFGVAAADAASGATVVVYREGTYSLTKTGAVSGLALAVGDTVYWDDVAYACTPLPTTSGVANFAIGTCVEAATTAATTAKVVLSGTAIRAGGTCVFVGRFDATSGKAIGTHAFGPSIPNGFRIRRAWTEVGTTFTSATDAATIALGVPTDSASGLKTALAISNGANFWDSGNHDLAPVDTVATMITLTAARQLQAVVAVEALTAGVMDVFVEGVLA